MLAAASPVDVICLIALNSRHLRQVLAERVVYFNAASLRGVLGSGLPDPPEDLPVRLHAHGHGVPPQ